MLMEYKWALVLILALKISYIPAYASNFFTENTRLSVDLSSRVIHNFDNNSNTNISALGLDIHKVFSNSTKDIGTLVFQPYLTRLDNVANPPFYFDDNDDTELIWRIANFNYKALNNGKLNIRLGHFEVPFGLEQNIDTNGTLRQYTSSDRGIKADWGISINGRTTKLDYEVSLTRGSGNQIETDDDPYIFAGRFGLPSHRNSIIGASWFYGDVLTGNGIIQRKKIGLDIAYYKENLEWLFEISIGETDKQETNNALLEMSWRDASENIHGYLQFKHQSTKTDVRDTNRTWVIGSRWQATNSLDFSAQYSYRWNRLGQLKSSNVAIVQARYRF